MPGVRNTYELVTPRASDSDKMIDLNNRYTAVRFESMREGQKWAINKGEVPLFDDFGVLPDIETVIVGEDRSALYLIRMEHKPKPICKAKSYRAYEYDEFIWVMGSAGDLSDPIINRSGKFLVHIRSGSFIECPDPPTMSESGKFDLRDGTVIRWKGSRFEKEREGAVEREEGEDFEIGDVRKDHLEEFLKENVSLEIISGASNMDEVDHSGTPEPIVNVFYDMGDGDFPEDPEGEFEPPDQEEFAVGAYRRFRKNAEDKEPFSDENRDAWVERLKNAWASLVRDVHFSFMMYQEQESTQCFDKVEFDKEKDVEEGIDFLVENDGVEYHINLFIDSDKSRRFLSQKKNYRQESEEEAVEVEVPMKFRGDEKKSIQTEGSELWLYSEDHIDAVKEIVLGDKDKVTRNNVVLCRKM